MRWLLGTTLWVNARYCECSLNMVYILFPNRHRLRAARERSTSYSEQPPPYLEECALAFLSAQMHQSGGPQLPSVDSLRCTLCYGWGRSASYHRNHGSDPTRFPAVGVCSRRRTSCKTRQGIMDMMVIQKLPAQSLTAVKERPLNKPSDRL